ncbi:hypothetical protein CKAN_00490700 [Cinnamomum micranthum f. kanehirae]|uniref:DUF3511 domain-containing protein n=1 Tax=Cinnamomum micranthum f. kanehirae TaxID=337451 RepID=A0A3S3NWC0_9MAGN|nr:hypothetical protein CKAN_00490700 [Cinnamomum micranthum f. kanehirae]
MGDSSQAEQPSQSRDMRLQETGAVKESNGRKHTHVTANQSRDRKPKNGNKVSSSSTPSSQWSFHDKEMRRKKRVAGYNMYSLEGRLKDAFRRGFHWIKEQCGNR